MVELAVAAAGRHPICRPLTAELVPSGMWLGPTSRSWNITVIMHHSGGRLR